MRINGFEQIKAFYSWVFNNADKRITPQHISLYLFLVNQNNRNNWVEWFKCPFDLGMAGSCIGNKKTYYKCLDDLQEWGMLEYEKGVNNWKSPLIKLAVLNRTATDTATTTATVPSSEPQHIPLPLPQHTHIYKPITLNTKQESKLDSEERKKVFYDECGKYLMVDGSLTPSEGKLSDRRYPKEMLKAFYNYWSEKSLKGDKLRFEKETTFEIPNRLATWYGRDKAKYDNMYSKKLPENWFNMDLTPEQMKLVPPEKLQEKKRHDVRRQMGI